MGVHVGSPVNRRRHTHVIGATAQPDRGELRDTYLDPTRRAVLLAGAAGAGTMALAACGSSGSGTTSSSVATGSSAAGSSAAPSTSGTSSSAAVSSGAPAAAGVAHLSDIPVGQAVSASVDGKPVIVARPDANSAVAFSAICTHMGCTVAPAGNELHCPCHGSRYNAVTGQVLRGPAPAPLPPVTVHVTNGEVIAG